MHKPPTFMQSAKTTASLLAAILLVAGCASLKSTSPHRLNDEVAKADAAYRQLKTNNTAGYNDAVARVVREIDGATPNELRAKLDSIGVKLDQPDIRLPLARYHTVPFVRLTNEPSAIGSPILLDYDTSNTPFYPRDGLVTPATAVYRRIDGEPHLSFVSGKDTVEVGAARYPLNVDNVSPVSEMARRGRHVAQSGFRNMLRPASMRERSGIYLTEPYDPTKAIVLVVPGLQSTPFAFADLMKTMRSERDVNAHFQVWTFLYATGTPVLFNALELREALEKTTSEVDPHHHDFATKHITVIGHSMGGVMAHTLVSSSTNSVWASVFSVPPQQLNGDPHTIRQVKDALIFRRNPNVVRAVFLATPHRGSKMAESWIGHMGESLIRLSPQMQNAYVELATKNPEAATPEAAATGRGFHFSSVRALSSKEPALHALAQLPIGVPFHTIAGQQHAGPLETSSDGVVTYTSSHLDGAASELIVRSGHSVCENREAQDEVIRILRLELPHGKPDNEAGSLARR